MGLAKDLAVVFPAKFWVLARCSNTEQAPNFKSTLIGSARSQLQMTSRLVSLYSQQGRLRGESGAKQDEPLDQSARPGLRVSNRDSFNRGLRIPKRSNL